MYKTKDDSRAALLCHTSVAAEHIRNHPDNNVSANHCLLMCAEQYKEETPVILKQVFSTGKWYIKTCHQSC